LLPICRVVRAVEPVGWRVAGSVPRSPAPRTRADAVAEITTRASSGGCASSVACTVTRASGSRIAYTWPLSLTPYTVAFETTGDPRMNASGCGRYSHTTAPLVWLSAYTVPWFAFVAETSFPSAYEMEAWKGPPGTVTDHRSEPALTSQAEIRTSPA